MEVWLPKKRKLFNLDFFGWCSISCSFLSFFLVLMGLNICLLKWC